METILLPFTHPDAISQALAFLQGGGLVAFPTDTVYGLAARVDDEAAIQRLFIAKGREWNKAIAVLIGDVEQISQVAQTMNQSALRLAAAFWPGALTIIVPRAENLPTCLSPLPTIGVRIPDHAFARKLLRSSGALATTSANLSGGANPLSAQDVVQQLAGRIDLILDGGLVAGGIPSTVVDCTADDIRILRQGAISEAAIRAALK